MTEHDPEFSELFEAFLDGQQQDRDRVEREMESDPYWSGQVELQNRINDATKRLYAAPEGLDIVPAELKVPEKSKEKVRIKDADASKANWGKVVIFALAASIAWIAVTLSFSSKMNRAERVAFHPQPLTGVYQTCVEEGFKPYWVCDDDFVFATTFSRRQGTPLKLEDLPAGREMVGLSYLAGISRRSTSMLATVDEKPVVVFVDKLENDWKPETGHFEDESLNVLRLEKLGLVFYEVTPFDEITVAKYFVPDTAYKPIE